MEKETIKILIIEFNAQNIIKIKEALSNSSDISYEISFLQKEENILKRIDDETF